MLGRAVMLNTLVMPENHGACTIVTGRAGAMHWTGYNRHSCATQRRDPRREENDGQTEGEQSAHHGCQIYREQLTAICQSETPSRRES